MRNPFTFVVESSLGAFFISLSAILFIALLYISVSNFNSDIEILNADQNQVSASTHYISSTEKILINSWANENSIQAPQGRSFYKYLIDKYPDRPWLEVIDE